MNTSGESIWNRTFTTVFIVNVLTALSFHILTPTLPKYTLSLGFSADIAGLVSTMFTVSAIIIRPFSGRLLDKRKKKNLLFLSLVIISVSILGYSRSTSIAWLIFFRLLHGVGWGITTVANSTIATNSLPKEKIGSGLGVFGVASSLASAVAPNLGLQLVQYVGYSTMFMTAFFIAATGCALSLSIVEKEPPRAEELRVPGIPKKRGLSDIAFSIFAKEAIFPAILMIFINISYSSIITFLSVYADQKGIGNVGYYFTVAAVFMIFTRPFFGRLNDRARKELIIYPCSLCLVSVFLLIFFSKSLLWLLVAAGLFGIGYGGLQPTIQVWCVKAAGQNNRAKANGTFYTAVDLGQGIGAYLAGTLSISIGYGRMYLCMIASVLSMVIIFTGHQIFRRGKRA